MADVSAIAQGILARRARGAPPPPLCPRRAFAPAACASRAQLTRHILALTSADYGAREAALLELSRKREDYADLAPLLWHSYGTITALLQVRGCAGVLRARARGQRRRRAPPPPPRPLCRRKSWRYTRTCRRRR